MLLFFFTKSSFTCDRFPPSSHPVLAFRGAPASFPVEEQNRQAHAFLKWSDKINKEVDEYIQNTLPKGPFVGIHLRNGIDWVKTKLKKLTLTMD